MTRSANPARKPLRRTSAVVAAAAATAVVGVPMALTAPAHAGGAESQFSYSFDFGPQQVNSVCAQPISVSGHIDAWGNGFDGQDSNGNLTITHTTETDVFTGPNGVELASLPYHYTVHYTDAGVNGASGFQEVIPLNNGTLFQSNGHVDYSKTPPGMDWGMVPTSGHAGDVAEFCAELGAS
jgi:hypothetical protein